MKSPYLTKRDEWAASFEGILQTRSEPRTDCPGIYHHHHHCHNHLKLVLVLTIKS